MPTKRKILKSVVEDVVAALRSGRSVLHQAARQGHEDVLRYLLGRINSSGSGSSDGSSGSGSSDGSSGSGSSDGSSGSGSNDGSSGSGSSDGSSSSGSNDGSSGSDSDEQLTSPVQQSQLQISNAVSEAVLGAAKQGHSNCLSALLESSVAVADMDALLSARNKRGATALMVASEFGNADCVKTLLRHNPEAQVAATNQAEPGWTALLYAAYQGHAECVTQLLQHLPEAQVAAADEGDTTALMFAASNGDAECMVQLLRHSPEAQVAAVNCEGDTALITAVSENHPDCVALLLAHSPAAQIAAVGSSGDTAVEIAARLGHPQCLDLLLAHNPQPQHLDAAWLSALWQWDAAAAHTSPHTQCLERLNAKGAMLPAAVSAQEADRAQNRLFMQDWGSRALVADRTNEAIVGLAVSVQSRKRKAGQEEH